jgi:PAS domain S-box-containing protein
MILGMECHFRARKVSFAGTFLSFVIVLSFYICYILDIRKVKIMQFTEDYQKTLYEYWVKYVKSEEPFPEKLPGIRPVVYESWKRARSYNVSPLEVKDEILDRSALDRILSYNSELISVAHPYIQNLYSFIKGSNFIIALTDVNGTVIDLIGQDSAIKEKAKKTGLVIGCNRSEHHAGTSGIGTCLATGKPIQIWGCEHYIEPHHSYVCSAAPIRDQQGKIVGCLDMVGPMESVSIHTLGMVCAAVDGIHKEMEMRSAYNKISIINKQLNSTIQSMGSGILMFDNIGIITQFNSSASSILKLTPEQLRNQNIVNILDMETASLNLLDINSNIENEEFFVVNSNGIKLNLSISVSIIYNDDHEKISTVLIIDELKRIHSMVHRFSGFTAKCTFDSIVGNSPAILKIKDMGRIASQSDSNVLIFGESGTGKDLLAQAIHNSSSRSKGPFIAINCGSLPKGLIESELFGYESGAFTGASKDGYPGKFNLADGGTIFLDEIGDMPLEMQASLLRVIQTKEVVRIGGKTAKQVDVRIIAATNRNLLESVKNNRFRSDLYYRLNVLDFVIPALRERKEDIIVLAEYFINIYGHTMNKKVKGISEKALDLMLSYNWPGNVRELENAIERALNLVQGDWITEAELPYEIVMQDRLAQNSYMEGIQPAGNREYEKIIKALAAESGNVSKASIALGVSKRTLYRRINKFNINLDNFRI